MFTSLEAEMLTETTAPRQGRRPVTVRSVATVEAYWSVNQRVIRNLSTFPVSSEAGVCLVAVITLDHEYSIT